MAEESSRRREGKGPVSAVDAMGVILAPVAIVCALFAVVALYRQIFPQLQAQPVAEEQAQTTSEDAQQQTEQPAYEGVEDPWMYDGTFTIGDAELDTTIKTFCDALSDGERDAPSAAQTVYNSMIWGNYTAREEGQKPQGRDWSMVAARLYFASAHPELGEAGDGDYYEYAAAFALCLRYFGYYYVTALPTIDFDEYGNAVYGAVDYVIDEQGNRYVIDFSQGTYGWMQDANYVDVVVDDIGQDLSDAEYLGLTINRDESAVVTGEDYSGYYEQDDSYTGDYAGDSQYTDEGSTGDYEDYGSTGDYADYGTGAYTDDGTGYV